MSTRVSAIRVVGGPADRAGLRVPVVLAAALACAYLVVAPDSPALAPQEFRAWLYGHAGFTLWDNNWYGGHPPPGYSLFFPPLGALVGVRLAGALSVVAAAALFSAIVRPGFGPGPAPPAGGAWVFGGGGPPPPTR